MPLLIKVFLLFAPVVAGGAAVNTANSENPEQYKNPKVAIDAAVDSVTDAYKQDGYTSFKLND